MNDQERIIDLRRQLAESLENNATLQRMMERQGYQLDRMQDQLERALRELAALRRLLHKPPDPPAPPPEKPANSTPSPESGEIPPPRPPKTPRKKAKHGRNGIPAGLERVPDRHTVEVCEKCGGTDQKELREEIVEIYDYQPAKLEVRQVIRAVCRCRGCQHIAMAPFPDELVPRLLASPALIATIIFEKHGRALSFHRVDQELRRLGASIPEATRDSWMAWAARQLEKLGPLLKSLLFEPGLLYSDGTGFDVIEPHLGTRLGQIAVYASERVTFYSFTPTKHGFHQRIFLGLEGPDGKPPSPETPRFSGFLVCDAASNADRNFQDGTVIECGCNAHARRKFEKAEESNRRLATEAIAFWTGLYGVEKEATRRKLDPAGRHRLRQEKSVAIVEDFRRWLDRHHGKGLPTDPLTKALNYLHNHWVALTRFLQDGRIPIDNNWSERLLKIVAIGRHNFMFAGSDRGAERSAIFFTVIATCRQHGVDPVAWLTDVLPRIAQTRESQLPELLPERWQAKRRAAEELAA